MRESPVGSPQDNAMRNPELRRLQAELAALQRVAPAERDARALADLELVRLRLDYLSTQAGIRVSASPYLAFLDRVAGAADEPVMAATA